MTTPRTAAEQLADIYDGVPPPGADLLIPQLAKQLLDEHRRLQDAFELLHGRVVGTCDLDANEAPPPAETFWADQLEQLLHTARELVGDIEPEKHPAHTVTVTKLAAGFDHNDKREHEYVVGNDTIGWTSHQVTHPAACHALPYGRACWLDETWYEGPYRYDEVAPGTYQATWVSEAVGDHLGEFSHMDEYVHYERTGDAPERPAKPEPWGGYSDGVPF